MYLPSTLIAGLLLAGAEGVLGGSRLWEAKAPNMRTNPSPEYPAMEELNTTSSLVRRAFSIGNHPENDEAPRLWPNKKIRYCFHEDTTVIRGLWNLATQVWAELADHGFTYEEVTDRGLCESERSTVLRVFYSDVNEGILSSTLGIPPVDRSATNIRQQGPSTTLSDKLGIGQDNIQANVAHELGHVWGLLHPHQNPQYWQISDIHKTDHQWTSWRNLVSIAGPKYFQTSGFQCQNLVDYDIAHAKVQAAIDEARLLDTKDSRTKADNLETTEMPLLCINRLVAEKWGFSAGEWLPYQELENKVTDPTFDRDSIMLYPSGAGGRGVGNARLPVMIYKDGTPIPNRIRPTGMDIDRLTTLYKNADSSPPGVLHVEKGSKFLDPFKKLKKKGSKYFHRGGDTKKKDGECS